MLSCNMAITHANIQQIYKGSMFIFFAAVDTADKNESVNSRRLLFVYGSVVCDASVFVDLFSVQRVKVVIVGGGVSAIAAGTKLLENGIDDFVILEAQDYYGGRINTVRFGMYRK